MGVKYDICHISRLRMGIDGEGIRELILTAGCPLRCQYCINPFTWDNSGQIEQLTAKEIFDRIKLDRPYILATNGGITIGGGEPLLQPGLFRELRSICDSEMTLYAETSLNVEWENIDCTTDVIDRYYIDIKTMEPSVYKEYTGGSIERVLENLTKLIGKIETDRIVVRIPIIPGLIDQKGQLLSKQKLEKLGIKHFDLFEYRRSHHDKVMIRNGSDDMTGF